MKLSVLAILCSLGRQVVVVQAALREYDLSMIFDPNAPVIGLDGLPAATLVCPEVDQYCVTSRLWSSRRADSNNFELSEFLRFPFGSTYRWLKESAAVDLLQCRESNKTDCLAFCDTACTCEQGVWEGGSEGGLNETSKAPCDIAAEHPDETISTRESRINYISSATLPEGMKTDCGTGIFAEPCLASNWLGVYGDFNSVVSSDISGRTFSECSSTEGCLARCNPTCTCTDEVDGSGAGGQDCTQAQLTFPPTTPGPTSAPSMAQPSMAPSAESTSAAEQVRMAMAALLGSLLGMVAVAVY
mmetsp:Transcript_7770/g.21669  ORF Transcript_7770/g.21669 Transcript_7770/m.21669 type:complete len:301 (-) Transcript_7770:84-986(-)